MVVGWHLEGAGQEQLIKWYEVLQSFNNVHDGIGMCQLNINSGPGTKEKRGKAKD